MNGETFDPFPRPGDANFTTFPKQVSEDTVKYSIRVIQSDEPSPAKRRSRLGEILSASKRLVRDFLKDFIWQRESFVLDFDQSGHSFLQGSTEFGDSITDEWVVVYVLRELSRQFEDAWIRVTDADGEFLLVEAANALPKWLNPEVADNRVWIHKGQIRLIPASITGQAPVKRSAEAIKLDQAIEMIRKKPQELIHSPQIEAEAFFRLKSYPERIAESMHTARVAIPRKLAYVLHRLPLTTSAAVESFYLRDPISMKPLQDKATTHLMFPPQDLVAMSISFNRVSYAQLKNQEFAPPGAWQRPEVYSNGRNDSETGMKLTCGYEMLVKDPQNQDKRVTREIKLLLDDLDDGEAALPSNADVADWSQREDDEGWLDVNFEDFERELSGKTGPGKSAKGPFGDSSAQDNLRRIVEQFETFMNDENAGTEGAEFGDDMDDDDEDDEDEDDDDDHNDDAEDSDDEDQAEHDDNGVDESHLDDMMKQMLQPSNMHRGLSQQVGKIEEVDSDEEDIDVAELQEVTRAMEAELREAGALDLNPPTPRGTKGSVNDQEAHSDDPRFQLAKNFLEALKQQPGQAGPAGNFMRSMGLDMPRNEERD